MDVEWYSVGRVTYAFCSLTDVFDKSYIELSDHAVTHERHIAYARFLLGTFADAMYVTNTTHILLIRDPHTASTVTGTPVYQPTVSIL